MKWRALVGTAAAVVLLASCGGQSPNDRAKRLDHVVYVDSVGGLGRDGYAYVALDKGFFEEEGLDVEIQKGSGTGENLKTLISNKAQFAALDGTGGILAAGASKDKPTYKMITLVHRRTLASIITMDPSIASFSDLEGRKVAMNAGGVNQRLFPGLAKLAGFDAKKVDVKLTKGVPALVSALTACQVDAVSTFLVQQAQIEKQAKDHLCAGWDAHARVLPYSTYVSDLIGTAVFASDKVIADKPDLVKRFQRAINRGADFSARTENFAATAESVHRSSPAVSIEDALGEIRSAAPYISPTDSKVGSLTRSQVDKVIALLAQNKLLPNPVTPEDVAWPELVPAI